MAWQRMWVLAWVVSGCCVGGSMGAVRAVWAVEGCGVSSTDEHPPAHLPVCLSACLSACLLPVCLPTYLGTLVSPTDRDTVHNGYHGTVVPVRTHETRGTNRQPIRAIVSFSTAVQGILQHSRAPSHSQRKSKAKDRGDRSTGQWIASMVIISCRRAQQCPPILSSPRLETDDICAT